MSPSGRDKPKLYNSLLKQGVARTEIDKVYRSLRDRGYGEEEARRRSHQILERMRAKKDLEERRQAVAEKVSTPEERTQPKPDTAPNGEAEKKRASDFLPPVPPALRWRINRWAYRRGFLITRLPERMNDILSFFDRTRPDLASTALVKLLASRKGSLAGDPYDLSFIDSLEALRAASTRLLGGAGLGREESDRAKVAAREENVMKSLRAREPFALEFFGIFASGHTVLRNSLEYLGARLKSGIPVEIKDLARVVKDGMRLILATERIEWEKLDALFLSVREVNIAHDRPPHAAKEMEQAESHFRAAFQNLARFSHELYPALLKMICSFYEEFDESSEKRAKILAFVDLAENEVMTYAAWQRREREKREQEQKEQQEKDLAELEQEKAEKLSLRFEGTLATMATIFPDSAIERVEQGEYILPYFINRVFARSPLLQSRLALLEGLPASDAMGLIIVLHMILDDMLSSVDPYALEKSAGAEDLTDGFLQIRDEWHAAYATLFDPYLTEIRDYNKEAGGDPRLAKSFRESARARAMEERANQLRNHAIKNFGHLLSARGGPSGRKLCELAEMLSELLDLAAQAVKDVSERVAAVSPSPGAPPAASALEAGRSPIVDFAARSQPGTADYRPVTRQIKRYIESRYNDLVSAIPQAAQMAFMDIFRGVADLYTYLLNDPRSPAARTSHGILSAGREEKEAWTREKSTRRDSGEALQARLKEEYPGQFTDMLTGLKNKDYFIKELPKKLEKIAAQGKALTAILFDIDHFKWVNDTLGHLKGDEVLAATATTILDGIREEDLAIRYGGEEVLVFVPSNLHAAVLLAERLRNAQERNIASRPSLEPVREVGRSRGESCCTLSVGVAEVTGVTDPSKAVALADRALYVAKTARNQVVFIDPAKKNVEQPFTTYPEYRQRMHSGNHRSAPPAS